MLWWALRGRPLILSYPKSGRTWLRVMLDELGIPVEFTHFEAGLRNHLRFDELVVNPLWCAGRPTLLLIRNPLDTLVSSYFQATKRLRIYSGPLSEFLRDPRYGIEKIARWNTLWAEQSLRHPRFRVVTYEALHADAGRVLDAVVRHFGRSVSKERLARALEAGNIDTMRERERAGSYGDRYRKKLRPGDASDVDSFKVRRGVVGGYREYLGSDDLRFAEEALAQHRYQNAIEAVLARTGLLV